VNTDLLGGLLASLEADLEAMGWDAPLRLYALAGERRDPRLDLVARAMCHPLDLLPTLPLFPSFVHGVALSTEGWALILPDEQVAEMYDALTAGGVPMTDHQRIISGFMEAEARKGPLRLHPLGKEVRTVVAVLRGGHSLTVMRARGQAPETVAQQMEGAVYDALFRLLR
jgi:hypothetical protein